MQRYNIPHAPIPETSRIGMNLRVIATYCELSRPQISTDIIIYWIITDFLFGPEIHGFIFNKGTAWLRMDITTALRDYGLLRKITA